MEIVRKYLTEDDLQPANTRYDDVTDTVQATNDGGATWYDVPNLDPRQQYQQPVVDTSDPQCDAAARMSAELESLVTAGIAGVDSAADAIQIGNIILSGVALMVGAPLFSALIFSAANYLISTGSTILHSEFDTFDWDELTCQFYCVVTDEGRLDQVGYETIIEYLNTLSLVQSAVIGANMLILGWGGLSDYARARTETGDCSACSDCGWCYTFDFSVDDGQVTPIADACNFVEGVWTGTAWAAVYADNLCSGGSSRVNRLWIRKTFPASADVQEVVVVYDRTLGAPNNQTLNGSLTLRDGAAVTATLTPTLTATGTDLTVTWNPGVTANQLEIFGYSAHRSGGALTSQGLLHVKSITFRGNGANPFGTDNCT